MIGDCTMTQLTCYAVSIPVSSTTACDTFRTHASRLNHTGMMTDLQEHVLHCLRPDKAAPHVDITSWHGVLLLCQHAGAHQANTYLLTVWHNSLRRHHHHRTPFKLPPQAWSHTLSMHPLSAATSAASIIISSGSLCCCCTCTACLQNLLDSRAQMAAKSASGTMTPTSPEASQHTADLLRMTRESMNGSFTAKLFNAAGTQCDHRHHWPCR